MFANPNALINRPLGTGSGGIGGIKAFAIAGFHAPLKSYLVLARGVGSPTFTRATTATVMGYAPTANSGDPQILLTVAAGEARFTGARRISQDVWSEFFADGTPIPDATLKGYLSESAATNYFLNSGAPVTQTITLNPGTYTTWLTGAGTITTSAGTATATGYGVASAATPNVIVVTVAGTVVFTVAGTVTTAQVENTAFPTSYIATTTVAVTRNADLLTYPYSDGANISIYLEVDYVGGGGSLMLTPVAAGSYLSMGNGDGSTGWYASGINGPTTGVHKQAISEAGLNFKSFADGAVLGSSAASDYTGTSNILTIGMRNNLPMTGNIRNVRIWQTALPDATLQALTT